MAETSREIGRLGISRAALQKQRERRRTTRKLRGDIRREEPEPLKIDELCSYFDLDCSSRPYRLVKSRWGDAYDIQLFGRLGLCCYNFEQGTNLKFVRWEKYYVTLTAYTNFYVTLEAMDPACKRILPFQTMVSDFGYGKGVIKWRSLASRLKCNDETVDEYWDETEEIDAFYKGAMPKWLFHVDADNKKYYVVQESELLENDWLHLFAEIALYSKSNWNLDAPPLLELKNVVIETKEEYTTEAREKLKADNAIFYISFKCNGDLSTGWGAGDHNAIIRKTMDGSPGHMSLEVASATEEERLSSDYQSLYI